MTSEVERPSAKIYQFPIRARAIPVFRGDHRLSEGIQPTSTQHVSCDSGWYHEAAIEAERTQQN